MVIVERLSSVLFPLINQQNVSKQVRLTLRLVHPADLIPAAECLTL